MATPPPPPPQPPPPPPPPPPAKGNNRALIIVLSIIGVIVLIIGGCTVTCAYFAHKASKKIGEYSREASKNPAMAAISMAVAFNPNVEVVSKDESTGKITLRNKKTGEVVTLDTT